MKDENMTVEILSLNKKNGMYETYSYVYLMKLSAPAGIVTLLS